MSYRKDYDFRREVLIHKTGGKLPESIFSEIIEVDWPAMGGFRDSSYRLVKGAFKVNRCNQACALDTKLARSSILAPLADEIGAAYLSCSSLRPFCWTSSHQIVSTLPD
jgi:hypothetical protein